MIPVVVLAGGLGTRLREETDVRPKPMVEIGGRPILWHIMKGYSHHGFNRFLVAVGYKGHVIRQYFLSYRDHHADFTVNLGDGSVDRHSAPPENWNVTVVETGAATMTGGRIKRLAEYLEGRFMVTYGDGVTDLDVAELVRFHESHGRLATVTAVRPAARFGSLELDGDQITAFAEKPQVGAGWINGGFFVFEREVLDWIPGDETLLEREPLEQLAQAGQLMAFRHGGFWEPMDTQRDLDHLNREWESGSAPWKVWNG